MALEKFYWNDRYIRGQNSGYGSYDEQLTKKLNWIKEHVHEVGSVTEIGCGDFNFGKHVMEALELNPAVYHGFDTSDVIIAKNRKKYPAYNFDEVEGAEIPPADLLMCVDVLFHVLEPKDCEQLLDNLGKLWTKYLVLTAYERDDEKVAGHVRVRTFDPSRFGTPIVREIVEEDGSLYCYIFKK